MKTTPLKYRMDRLMREKRLFLDADLTICRVAKEVCSNRTYVSELFRYYGESFREYISNHRTEHALLLIKKGIAAGEIPEVADIALMSGFKNERTLNKYLNEKFGKTASKIIRELKNDYLCPKSNTNGGRKDHFFNERSGQNAAAQ